MFLVVDGQVVVLGSALGASFQPLTQPGYLLGTSRTTWQYAFLTGGTFEVAFGVADIDDTEVDSALLIDRCRSARRSPNRPWCALGTVIAGVLGRRRAPSGHAGTGLWHRAAGYFGSPVRSRGDAQRRRCRGRADERGVHRDGPVRCASNQYKPEIEWMFPSNTSPTMRPAALTIGLPNCRR